MNTTHTPGPWQVASEATATVLGPAKTGLRIIAVAESPDQTANARLIAAAPELLASCEAAVRYLEKVKELAVSLSAMVPNLPPITAGTIASDLHTVCSNTRKIRAAIAKAKGQA